MLGSRTPQQNRCFYDVALFMHLDCSGVSCQVLEVSAVAMCVFSACGAQRARKRSLRIRFATLINRQLLIINPASYV